MEAALDTVVQGYGDKSIISLVESFIKRGRLTLQENDEIMKMVFSQHNKARLGAKKEFESAMKAKIKEACKRFLSTE